MNNYEIDILGLSAMRWSGCGRKLHTRVKLPQNVEDVEAHKGSFKAIFHEVAMKMLGRR